MMIRSFILISGLTVFLIACENGSQKEYYSNGNIMIEIKESKGKLIRKKYYENGVLENEGELQTDGNRTGPWKYYNIDKSEKASGIYNDGLKDGGWNYNIEGKKYNVDWSSYVRRPIKINIPANWIIKEDLSETIPVAAFSDSSGKDASFNILLVKKEGKSIDSIINETIARGRNTLGYSIEIISQENVEINGIHGKEVSQKLSADGRSLLVKQYFLEKDESIYLVSTFVNQNIRDAYELILTEIAYSIFLI